MFATVKALLAPEAYGERPCRDKRQTAYPQMGCSAHNSIRKRRYSYKGNLSFNWQNLYVPCDVLQRMKEDDNDWH
jgi:hypothetical protein